MAWVFHHLLFWTVLGANPGLNPLLVYLIETTVVLNEPVEVLHRDLGDSKYRPAPLLVNYVAAWPDVALMTVTLLGNLTHKTFLQVQEAGWLGKKTKRGFYDYS